MSNSTTTDVIIGVDTHKDFHFAVPINAFGVHLATTTVPASSKGYQTLEVWAKTTGAIRAIGVKCLSGNILNH